MSTVATIPTTAPRETRIREDIRKNADGNVENVTWARDLLTKYIADTTARGGDLDVLTITDFTNKLAEAQAIHRAWAELAHYLAIFDEKAAGDPAWMTFGDWCADMCRSLVRYLQPADTYSGRTNDVRRAQFAGKLSAIQDIVGLLADR